MIHALRSVLFEIQGPALYNLVVNTWAIGHYDIIYRASPELKGECILYVMPERPCTVANILYTVANALYFCYIHHKIAV